MKKITVSIPDKYIDEFISNCEKKTEGVGDAYFMYVRKAVALFENIEIPEPIEEETLGKLLAAMTVNEVMNRITINNKQE